MPISSRRRFSFVISLLIMIAFAIIPNYNNKGRLGTVQVEAITTVADSFMRNGLCYGPYHDGQDPDRGSFPTTEQIEADLRFLKDFTKCIRTYGSTNTLASIPSIAKQYLLQVYQGVNLSNDTQQDQAEISSAISLANQGLIESVIVGNEAILSGSLSETQLIQYIRQVQQNVPDNVTVTTAEPWSTWVAHSELVDEVDYMMIHVHPFWENQPIDQAAAYVLEKYRAIETMYPNQRIVVGEIGWPSAGNSTWTGVSVLTIPSAENQKRFIEEFTQLADSNHVQYFFFDAFDEEWKWSERRSSSSFEELTLPLNRTFSGSYAGSSWGIFQSNGDVKPLLSDFFDAVPTIGLRKIQEIFVRGNLSAGYDMGVDSSEGLTNWTSIVNDSVCMEYPAGQSWGAIFITIGAPADPPRPWKSFSESQNISLELRGENGGESVAFGLKDADDPDDGTESKIIISDLGTDWQTFTIDLTSLSSANLTKLYVVTEFVFSTAESQTAYFRNIRFIASHVEGLILPENIHVIPMQPANFTVTASGGKAPYTYQWYEGTTILNGQTSAKLIALKSSAGNYTYYCRIIGSDGKVAYSNIVKLEVSPDIPEFHSWFVLTLFVVLIVIAIDLVHARKKNLEDFAQEKEGTK